MSNIIKTEFKAPDGNGGYNICYFKTSADMVEGLEDYSGGGKVVSIVPTQSNILTYDGTEQSPTWNSFNDTKLAITEGVTKAVNAGKYPVKFKPINGYEWEDGSNQEKDSFWTIAGHSIEVEPTVTGTFTYDGDSHSPTIEGYDSDTMTMTGTTEATTAGTYTVSFTPQTNHQWSNGSFSAKEYPWTIDKAQGSISLSTDTVVLAAGTAVSTVEVTRSGDGVITAVSSDTGIATVSVSDTTVSISGIASGHTTITISVAEGTNYLATDTTIAVTSTIPNDTLNDNTWETISEVAKSGSGDLFWDVGDAKEITLNGKVGSQLTLSDTKLCVFILDFNYKMNGADENNIIFGGFKSALTDGVDVVLVDSKNNSTSMDGTICFNMNHRGQMSNGSSPGYYNTNYGGWKGSDLRYDILGATSTQPSMYNQNKSTSNVGYDATEETLTSPKADTLLAALPSDLRSVMRLWTRWIDAVGNSSNVDANIKATVDAITLLAEPEIFSTRSYANQYEQNHLTQMAYYANGNSPKRYSYNNTTSAVYWWESSPDYANTLSFCRVSTDGSATNNNANNVYGLAPAFKIYRLQIVAKCAKKKPF